MALVTSWQWIAMRDPLWLSTWSSHDSTIGAAFNVCRHYMNVNVDFLFVFLLAFAASPPLFDKISLSRHFMRDAANKWPQTERCEKCSLCVCGNFAIVIMDSNTYSNKCLYVCKQLTIIQHSNTEMHYYCQGSGPETFPAYQRSALSEYYDSNWDKTHAELLPNTLKHANAYYHLCSTWSAIDDEYYNTLHCHAHISSLLLLGRTSWFVKETDHILQALHCTEEHMNMTLLWWCGAYIMMMIIRDHLS